MAEMRQSAAAPPFGPVPPAGVPRAAHHWRARRAEPAGGRLVEAFPTAVQPRHEYGMILQRAGRTADARAAIATLPESGPIGAERAYLLGSFDTLLGDPASSRAELMKAVAANPLHGGAWLALAMVGNLTADTEAADLILGAARNISTMQLPDSYFYALGKVYADRGEHSPAFEAFLQGAATLKPQRPYDRKIDEAFVQSAIEGSSAKTLAQAAETIEVRSARPIFVTGMPRSGTTLVEQIVTWMRRDPLDCAWSCFRTHFAEGAPWSNDLADIAWVMRLEDRLLAHWQPILGHRLQVLSYEQLVTEPADKIPAILAHCGLAMEPAVLTPHETKRAVTTSSVTQVRRPINREGIGAAAPYREWLEPFIRAYGA